MNSLSKLDIDTLNEYHIPITEELINKVNDGYPIQYIVGNANFYGYLFKVNESVLIPRFETELLVEKIINKINFPINKAIDLCSGSGIIGITLSKKLNINVDMLELSKDAIEVLKDNVNNLQVINTNIIEEDIFKYNIPDEYELIVANPPYLTLNDDVNPNTRFEPSMALYSNGDGIKFYKRIINQLPSLKKWQLVAFEIGENQANDIINYAHSLNINNIHVEQDYTNRDRYIFIYHE